MASVSNLLEKVRGTQEDESTLAYLNQLFSTCQSNRLQFEKQWYTNIAFYFGRQYIEWTTSLNGPTTKMYEPIAPPWRVRMISNQIRRYTRKEMSKIVSQEPIGFVLPASGDDADLAAARAGDAIIEHEWRELKINREKRRAVWWQVVCGTGFLKDWYDENAPADPPGTKGSAVVENITPFNIFVPDILQEDIERQVCVIHGASKDPDWVEARYGNRPTSEGKYSEGGFEDKFMSAMGLHQEQHKSTCYVKEAWFKPGSSRFPDGAVIIWCGDRILHLQRTWPFLHNEYPFTKLEHVPTGRFYSESSITDLIPLQKEYNKSRSQIHEAKNKTAMPQMMAVKGSVDIKRITSEPGLVIEYRPPVEPKMTTPPNIPSYMINELDRIRLDMDDIASQHEVSRGQTPPNVEAATAISFLQEQDDSALANATASVEEASEKIGRHLLGYVNLYWEQDRIVRVIGYNAQFESFMFSKESLNGTTSYHVQAGSARPRSLAAKEARLFELIDRQLVAPQQALRFLEMGDASRLYEEVMIDNRHAQRENLKMLNQIPVMVNNFDNDIAHILEHDNWRKRQEYEAAPDEIKMTLHNHVREHKIRLIMLNGYSPPPAESNPQDPQGEPIYNDLVIDSMAYRLIMGIPIQPFDTFGQQGANSQGAVDTGTSQETQSGA